ncbi:ubiquitin-conjugating enzyme E2 U [Tachyglossus aculeatus]|uniref:ubiquitin-conjugating enzyme E2 U n=1 Tax=Tachyglossus aculeatus TaxID=9261 RepID=UPI0018F58351|nr:ubiquitin-conjugating enzyme E2 U [Tachyglossus aculeatus]
MHSGAYWLLEREYLQLKDTSLFGITAAPVADDLLMWRAEIQGLKDSLWEGALLQLSIKFPKEYNQAPPDVTFNTIPFHPNVDMHSGRPCVDFLDNPEEWDGRYSLSSVLLAIQVLLSNPVLENAVNVEAAEMMRNNMSLYRQIVMDCVRASHSLQVLEDKEVDVPSVEFFLPPEATAEDQRRKIKRISFEDYLRTWSEIATSRAAHCFGIPLFEEPHFIEKYQSWKQNNIKAPGLWDDRFASLLSEITRKRTMLPRAKKTQVHVACPTPDPNPLEPAAGGRIEGKVNMREEELWGKIVSAVMNDAAEDELWDPEVENLIAWSNTLGSGGLDD